MTISSIGRAVPTTIQAAKTLAQVLDNAADAPPLLSVLPLTASVVATHAAPARVVALKAPMKNAIMQAADLHRALSARGFVERSDDNSQESDLIDAVPQLAELVQLWVSVLAARATPATASAPQAQVNKHAITPVVDLNRTLREQGIVASSGAINLFAGADKDRAFDALWLVQMNNRERMSQQEIVQISQQVLLSTNASKLARDASVTEAQGKIAGASMGIAIHAVGTASSLKSGNVLAKSQKTNVVGSQSLRADAQKFMRAGEHETAEAANRQAGILDLMHEKQQRIAGKWTESGKLTSTFGNSTQGLVAGGAEMDAAQQRQQSAQTQTTAEVVSRNVEAKSKLADQLQQAEQTMLELLKALSDGRAAVLDAVARNLR